LIFWLADANKTKLDSLATGELQRMPVGNPENSHEKDYFNKHGR
jgi:hypothetical protein